MQSTKQDAGHRVRFKLSTPLCILVTSSLFRNLPLASVVTQKKSIVSSKL
jgi:hypothetical protein